MQIIPAIDLKGHQVVRLSQGKMDQAIVYSSDPLQIAKRWIDQGAKRIHLVDLNGAFEGKPIHFGEVRQISQAYPHIKIEIGGGIRSLDVIDQYMKAGVSYCILGTVAIKNPDLMKKACHKYPSKIILGIDAKDGWVATEGWDAVSRISAQDLSRQFCHDSLESIIYTDISKDGMLQGMNISAIKKMVDGSPFRIIASGGFTSLDDVRELKKIPNLYGMIAGKALYEGRVDLKEAIRIANG